MDIKKLVPKHKDDQEVIKRLKELSFEQIKPIIPDLLEWLQDINWPIAGAVATILKPFSHKIVPEIINILKTNDGLWKLWVLTMLVRTPTDAFLLKELERIAKFPTREEIQEGVDVEAMEILRGDYK